MDEWHLIDTAEKEPAVLVLGFFGGLVETMRWSPKFAEAFGDTSPGWYCDSLGRRVHPTHWMPLPAPPSASSPETLTASHALRPAP
jgi:hypothetical protein